MAPETFTTTTGSRKILYEVGDENVLILYANCSPIILSKRLINQLTSSPDHTQSKALNSVVDGLPNRVNRLTAIRQFVFAVERGAVVL